MPGNRREFLAPLQTRRWVEAQKDKLWAGDVEGILISLTRLRPAGKEAQEIVRTNRHYFETNRERMRYARFREKGYFIGSGVIESACKQIVTVRLKRSSMRWSRLGHGARRRSGTPAPSGRRA